MIPAAKATKISLLDFKTPQMRAFHMTWVSFFLCFVGWFAIAPLTNVIAKDLKLTKDQIANTIIASVAITILARLIIGAICDRFGPRKTYTWLMLIGALPIMCIGFAHDYTTFLLGRLAIGAIGASFVVTQFHTTQMFATNCVGAANATAAGWGNMGAGATNMLMPLIFGGFVSLGFSEHIGWRLAMIVPGVLMLIAGVAYWFLTQDCPAGNFDELRARGENVENAKRAVKGGFWIACKDYRVWVLALVYGACFGIEIIIHNSAAKYFEDTYKLDLKTAGLIAGAFGGLAFFARGLGGWISDKIAKNFGLQGRSALLGMLLLGQGISMLLFATSGALAGSIVGLMCFGVFVHMAAGGTYAVIPFINKKVLGSVAGIVGAGGNVGAVLAGFLLKVNGLSYTSAIAYLGGFVIFAALIAFTVRFSEVDEKSARAEFSAGTAKQALANAAAIATAPFAAGE